MHLLSGLRFERWPLLVVEAVSLFVVATFVFDTIHCLLHVCLNSRFRLLRALARPHQDHHDFFDLQLRIHPEVAGRNLRWHVLPEFTTQMAVCALALLVLDPLAVVVVMGFFGLAFVIVVLSRGVDRHHLPIDVLPAEQGAAFVRASYHALHHIFPGSYMSSYTMLFDRLMGTACQLRGRTVALTGASGAFGAALQTRLERAGARVITLKYGRDYSAADYAGVEEALCAADILALCHGSKGADALWANCDSFVALIERFKTLTAARRFPPEVWAVGSEIECHPAFGVPELQRYAHSKRAFARHAARYFFDRDILYRHIVPAAFRSRMGPGLISARTAAAITLFLIRRGFRYVPVTYTGIALINAVPFQVRAWRAGAAPLTRRAAVPDLTGGDLLTPSPLAGEGWGEGCGEERRPDPSPSP